MSRWKMLPVELRKGIVQQQKNAQRTYQTRDLKKHYVEMLKELDFNVYTAAHGQVLITWNYHEPPASLVTAFFEMWEARIVNG